MSKIFMVSAFGSEVEKAREIKKQKFWKEIIHLLSIFI
jgi:hypothetical protein